MKDKIYIPIAQFTIKQKIFVIKDNSIKETHESTLKTLNKDIFSLSGRHNIYNVVIGGSEDFNKKIKHDLEEEEMFYFNTHKLKVELE